MVGEMGGLKAGWMDGRMVGEMDGLKARWMDGRVGGWLGT
jgi:hypothetical protein